MLCVQCGVQARCLACRPYARQSVREEEAQVLARLGRALDTTAYDRWALTASGALLVQVVLMGVGWAG